LNSIETVAFENLPVDPQFSYKVNHLTFHFSAIDWASPQKIKYSYKIDGLNKDWSIPSEETKADYRNLPSGTHTFSLRAIGESLTWSQPYTYTFVINPPWWYSWWAMVMYSLLGGFVLYGSYQYQLNRKLEMEEKKRLIELDRIKNRLYTNITHEFRTPLTLIHGPVSQALSRNTGLEQKEIQSIHRQSERMQVLINQMLELQKLEAGMLKPNYAYGEIILMLKNLFHSFETWSGEKNISLIFSSTLHEVYMDFDAEKINQVITNLVSNAVKHTPRNGKVAMIVRASDSGDELIIEIRDTGVGISEEDLPHIFDRYYQTNRAAAGGTGIGLALVKNLVDLLGGKITVESKLDIGSSFVLYLPITRHASGLKNATPESGIFSAEEHGDEMQFMPDEKMKGQKPFILVIEDNHEVSAYIVSCLQKEYTVITAFNGNDGIRQAIDNTPDLIISDVMMPGKDGFEVCREVKEGHPHQSYSVHTSHWAGEIRKGLMTGIEFGADAYIIKPFNPEELLLRIQKLLELRATLSIYYRQHSGAEKLPVNEQASVQENAFLVKLRSIIEEHIDDPQFSILKLSQSMAMSHPQLHRKITSLTGESTGKFVRSVRLSKAVQWLKDSDLTIAEIAYQAGFSDPGYFTKVFSKEFGESPSEYRNKLA
jgi:signal transduction histidine kinase/DNA-binding response OmpR family regulator